MNETQLAHRRENGVKAETVRKNAAFALHSHPIRTHTKNKLSQGFWLI
jgi:hypothetical protein